MSAGVSSRARGIRLLLHQILKCALTLIGDVDARTYRERYLMPLGRGREPLAEFQRAALVETRPH